MTCAFPIDTTIELTNTDNMKIIKGKKLLIIGGNALETEIVKRVQERGAYAVVADFYEDYKDAPAKIYADEVWNVDWNDTHKLKEMCIKHNIDGALAGFSEFKVEALIRLTSAMGWPCYITQEQLEITSDKRKFKIECAKYGIPIVPQYHSVDDVNSYPVIVKPVDRGGSIGISVCYNREELDRAYMNAINLSPSSNVIIEKYLGNLRKIDLYYVIQNGVPTLFSTSDTIMRGNSSKGLEILQLGWLFPSKHHKVICESVDIGICSMLKGMVIENGYITISGFIDKQNNIYIFESGCRLSGELSYKRLQQLTGSSYLDMLIDIAIYGKPEKIDYSSDVKQSEYMLVENYFLKNGEVAKKIENIDKEGTEYVDLLFNSKIVDHRGSLLPKGAMIFAYGKDKDELISNVNYANSHYDIIDESSKSLIATKPTGEDLKLYFESDL